LFQAAATPELLAALQARVFSPALAAWFAGHGRGFTKSPVVIQGGDGEWSVSDGEAAYLVHLEAGVLRVCALPDAAGRTLASAPRSAVPAIVLTGTRAGVSTAWSPRRDLLGSGPDDPHFVLEPESDGRARIRFGDDAHGKRPDADTAFTATYRFGNGVAGNIGADALAHVVTLDARVVGVGNPLPAQGGTDPEGLDEVRRDAPQAFRVQERAVTPEDYAEVAQRHRPVQRAAATFRWTGSWHTVFVTADRKGGGEVDAAFEAGLRSHLERYRMAGYDLEVDGPRYAPLEIEITVCVKPDYFRAHVRKALLAVLGSGVRPDGERALFHPDRFTFGQPVYLSAVVAAAQSVEGVESVVVETFQRKGEADRTPLDQGVLPMGRLEIARLDNDPNFPERGVLRLKLGGGR
jgi:predicted phage baseplate assembly protein